MTKPRALTLGPARSGITINQRKPNRVRNLAHFYAAPHGPQGKRKLVPFRRRDPTEPQIYFPTVLNDQGAPGQRAPVCVTCVDATRSIQFKHWLFLLDGDE